MSAGWTNTFSVNGAGDPEALTVQADCKEVFCRQQGMTNTTDVLQYMPATTSTPVKRIAGELIQFKATPQKGFFAKGTVLCYLATADGSTITMDAWGTS